MCEAVADTVADAEGIDPEALSPQLDNAINTHALNEIIATTDSDTHVTFVYYGYEITVRGDSHVSIDNHTE